MEEEGARMPIRFSDISDAYQFATVGEGEAYVDRRTGKSYLRSDYTDSFSPDEDGEESEPSDLDSGDWIALPDSRELGLGKPLALAFAREHLPGDVDEVAEIFGQRGAYQRFKALLHGRGALEQWYAFSNAAEEAALRELCEAKGLEIEPE
jgi:hypothetical protein